MWTNATPRAIEALKYIGGVVNKQTGKDMVITSGARCAKYNKSIGGAPNSAHILGEAFDISTPDSGTRYWALRAMIEYGIERIGWNRDKKFLHGDCCTEKDKLPAEPQKTFPTKVAFDY